ncbi:GNAT family N-acetyltransferase [Bremerella cremea]|uniref:GNAT family N-acetyltransferase n=1 Tax=Bremerella cremea TaxID=1031537 RepID=A0A368KM50_9BACT|nr:GNAT family N-acetyltransferase [Bremerella cremea]RCS40707.1 GNAT family N-acetyltransferase [Bremerella cremea]
MLRVLEINEPEDLSHVRGNWQRLWEATKDATFFQTLEWLLIYWKHFREDKKLRVLLVLEDERLVGVVPLVVVNEPTRLGKVRVLTYPLSDWGSHFSVLAAEPRQTLYRALRHLQETPRDWDMLDFRWLDEEDLEHHLTAGAMQDAGYTAHEGIWDETTLIDFEGNWDDYLRSRSPKLRSDIRRNLRRYEKTQRINFERYRPLGKQAGDDDPRWDLFHEAMNIAELSWQGHSTTGTTISHRTIRSYIKDCHIAAAELGMLDLAILYFEHQPAGFCYNYVANGRVFGLRRGDAPEGRAHGLGTVLTAMLIRDSFTRGDKSLDMGPGSFEAKRRWMTRIAKVGRMTHYPLTVPRIQLLRLKHWWQACRDRKSGRIPNSELNRLAT